MPSIRRVLPVATVFLIAAGVPASAQQQRPPDPPSLVLECTQGSSTQPLGSGDIIVCTVTSSGTEVVGYPVDAELLAGSISDTDATAAPPDYTATSDENGQVSFVLDGAGEGTDSLCIWLDKNNGDDFNEGSQECADDNDTELITRTWSQAITAPVLKIERSGIPDAKAREFLLGLGVTPKQLKQYGEARKDSTILFINKKRFQKIPTKPYEGDVAPDEDGKKVTPVTINIGALKKLQPISQGVAQRRVIDALDKSEIAPRDLFPKGVKVEWHAAHGELELLSAPTANRVQASGFEAGTFELDTTISNSISIGGTPLTGPGQNLRVSFDAAGKVSFVRLETRKLSIGEEVRILTPTSAQDRCRETYVQDNAQSANVTFAADLVYYAPELKFGKASTVYPHYNCTATVQDGNTTIEVRPFEVPALPALDLPRATATASNSGPTVTANSTVTGGTPPYRYQWSSVLHEIPTEVATSGPTVSYDLRVREESPVTFEILKLTVTDANWIRVHDFAYTPVDAIEGGVPTETSQIAYGTHYVGETYRERARLRWPAPNTEGFKTVMDTAGVSRNYSLGERLVWELDWVDPDLRATGQDEDYADNVDIFWFTGHANGDLYQLSAGANHDDDTVAFFDVAWGDRDLEWANIAACGPLQASTGSGSLQTRWGPAFQGLHILNGYATVSSDGDREGRTLASHLVGAGGLAPQMVRRAWSLMAIDAQGPTVIHGSMGPIGSDWLTPINDHFWGRGVTGPDIPASDTIGYWVFRYPS